MGLFYLLTLYCLLRGATSAGRPWTWYAAAVLTCALGMGSKEVMVTAPLVALLYDRIFLAPSWAAVVRRRWGLYLSLGATWVLLGGSLVFAFGARAACKGAAGFGLESVTPWEYARSQPGVILHYLRVAFWPYPTCLDYDWPVAATWPAIALPTLLVSGLALATLWALWRRPAFGFLGAAFFIILAPTSSIMPIADLAAEHRMYLPLAAVAALIVLGGYVILVKRPWAWRLGAACLTLVLLVLIGVTIARNEVYQSEVAVWSDVLTQRPDNDRAHYNLGRALAAEGLVDGAIEQYTTALRLNPHYPDALNALGVAWREKGDLDRAIDCYRKALHLKPDHALGHNNLGAALRRQGHLDSATREFQLAVAADPRCALAHNNLGEVLGWQGQKTSALASFRKAVALAPGEVRYRCNLAEALGEAGETAAAMTEYQAASALFLDWPEAASQSAWHLATCPDAGVRDGRLALKYARQACQATRNQRPKFLDTLASAYAECGCFPEAVKAANQAMALAAKLGRTDLTGQVQSRLILYEQGRPFRDQEPSPSVSPTRP
jgi:Flp pilus assembly protein TadD